MSDLRARAAATRAMPSVAAYEALMDAALDRIEQLEAALRLHNRTPSGRVRECLPGCVACAAIGDQP